MAETNMSIFYYKSNGDIYSICSGVQPIETFLGEHSSDLMQIIECVVVTYDNYVIKNINSFKVDITKTPAILVLIPDVQTNTYPVATS